VLCRYLLHGLRGLFFQPGGVGERGSAFGVLVGGHGAALVDAWTEFVSAGLHAAPRVRPPAALAVTGHKISKASANSILDIMLYEKRVPFYLVYKTTMS
jgi:hypothetical protein